MGNIDYLPLEHEYKEFVSPLIVTRNGNKHTSGSAFFIAPNIAITATHNIEGLIKISEPRFRNGINLSAAESYSVKSGFQLIRQIMRGGEGYIVVETVEKIHICQSTKDIAILFTRVPENIKNLKIASTIVNFSPPKKESEIKAYGYSDAIIGFEGREELEEGLPEGYIGFGSEFVESAGRVLQVENTEWEGLRKFPFFSAETDYFPGMSGGPVFDDQGYVCGMVTSSEIDESNGKTFAYAASLWPIAGEFISYSQESPPICLMELIRNDKDPNFSPIIHSVNAELLGIEYKMLDYNPILHKVSLLQDGTIYAVNIEYRES